MALFIAPLFCQAQKQGNNWFFGDSNGLNFNGGSPVIVTGGKTGSDVPPGMQEGTGCISDSSGSLLFYTSGKTIWNRFHQIMPNGTGIMGGTSSTQAALIVPKPGNDSLFYVFTSDEFQNFFAPKISRGYRYSIVNMCLDGGNGDVMLNQKNILLMDSSTEKLAACRDQAGNGYWVLGHKMFSDEFRAWHLTSSGISTVVSSFVGTLHGWHYQQGSWLRPSAQGQMKISPQGNKIALAISNFDPGYVDIFDFNNSTGLVTNSCHEVIDSAIGGRVFGVEFSPDGSKLYASGGGGCCVRTYQYDLLAGGGACSVIRASRTLVTQSNQTGINTGLQLSPEGKIYSVFNSWNSLSCINAPNLSVPSCNFIPAVINLNKLFTLPSFVAGYNYSNKLVLCGIEAIKAGIYAENNSELTFFPNPSANEIRIESGSAIGELIVRDSQSRLIFQKNVDKNSIIINLEDAGIYVLTFRSGGMTKNKKLVIQP